MLNLMHKWKHNDLYMNEMTPTLSKLLHRNRSLETDIVLSLVEFRARACPTDEYSFRQIYMPES